MRKTISTTALAALLMFPVAVTAGPTPEQKCEAGKNDAAGKYDACTAKAEKGLVSTGDMAKYGDALVKCEGKLVDKWTKLESAAVAAAAVCPSTGDQVAIQDFVDACVQSVAVALGGGTLGPDPVTCDADLGTCTGDLGTCTGSLGTCNGNLGTCTGSLATCNSDLSTTNADLTSCADDLGTCNTHLSTTNADLGTCTGNLATANGGTAAVGDVLSGKTFTSTAGLGTTGTMPNNGAVTLTPTTSDQAIAAGYHDGSGECEGDADLVAANIKNGVNLFGVTGSVSAGGLQKTGQTICYNTPGSVIACAGTGHDGELQNGVARSFTDNGDGTITDNLTGLMWEKQSDDGGIHDKDNTYTWDAAFASKLVTLNGGGGFAGHTDWRVPNIVELESLKNFGAVSPAVYSAFNTNCAATCTVTTCSCTKSYTYWSSSTYQSGPTLVWTLYFFDGRTEFDDKTNVRALRAVRTGS
jgi:hypothetical protein